MIIVGIILIAIGAGLFYYKKRLDDKLLDIKYYDKTDVKSVLEICNSVSKELGTGHFSQMVKISGKSGMDEPLIGEFSNAACVYYEVSAQHKFKRLVENRDSNGKVTKDWVAGSESIGSAEVGGEFWLNDGTAKVNIDIAGAEMTMETAVNESKSTRRQIDFSFGSYHPENSSRKKSEGYSLSERHIKTNDNLFVIGELNDRSGIPSISKPADKDNPYIVSIQSEEKVISKLEGKIKLVIFGAGAAAIGGLVLIVMSFIK
jgi:hypothetical protein